MDINKIKVILFDFGGTLDHDGKNWGTRIYDRLTNEGLKLNRDDFFNAYNRAMTLVNSDDASKTLTYKETVDVVIYWTLKYLEIIIEEYKNVLTNPFYMDSLQYISRNRNLLEALSKKYTLGIISNNFGNCDSWCKEFNIKKYFKIITDSKIVNMEKPQKDIFIHTIKKLDYNANECVYVGDKYDVDITTPLILGMHPVLINNEKGQAKMSGNFLRIDSLMKLKDLFQVKLDIKLLI